MWIDLFEDQYVPRLHPITLGRPAYAISCGSLRLLDQLRTLNLPIRSSVREHLRELQKVDYPDLRENGPEEGGARLLVNARLVPSQQNLELIKRWSSDPRDRVARSSDGIALASISAETGRTLDEAPSIPIRPRQGVQLPNLADLPRMEEVGESPDLFRYPHDVVRFNMEVLPDNLEVRIASGEYEQMADGVFLAPGAKMEAHVVTDTSDGPLLLDRDSRVGPFCLLRGPCYLGQRSRLNEHAAIKDHVSVAHTAKIGGEVEASVIEAYSNKQHHGFLGHSYLGSWINLGAGTCNSDLKNTYGTVNMEYRGEKVSTGMQFVGCIMGDYAKTAINTGLFTGKVIGVCSMLYGFITTNVPSFVNYARLFGQVTVLPPEVMISTQERMFRRRNVEQRPCDIQLIQDMYELTSEDRQLAGEPLAL